MGACILLFPWSEIIVFCSCGDWGNCNWCGGGYDADYVWYCWKADSHYKYHISASFCLNRTQFRAYTQWRINASILSLSEARMKPIQTLVYRTPVLPKWQRWKRCAECRHSRFNPCHRVLAMSSTQILEFTKSCYSHIREVRCIRPSWFQNSQYHRHHCPL